MRDSSIIITSYSFANMQEIEGISLRYGEVKYVCFLRRGSTANWRISLILFLIGSNRHSISLQMRMQVSCLMIFSSCIIGVLVIYCF